MEPFFSVLLSALFLNERPTLAVIAALLPIVGGAPACPPLQPSYEGQRVRTALLPECLPPALPAVLLSLLASRGCTAPARCWGQPKWPRRGPCADTGLMVPGVALASASEATFNWTGFLSAMGSNLTFQSRNVFSKKVMSRQKVPSPQGRRGLA